MKVKNNTFSAEEVREENSNRVEVSATKTVKKANKALALLFKVFDLENKGYVMTAFKDKGNVCAVELANADYVLGVTIRDCEAFGLNGEGDEQ